MPSHKACARPQAWASEVPLSHSLGRCGLGGGGEETGAQRGGRAYPKSTSRLQK